MSKRLGVLTIGEAPRADDTVRELRQVLGPELRDRGARRAGRAHARGGRRAGAPGRASTC